MLTGMEKETKPVRASAMDVVTPRLPASEPVAVAPAPPAEAADPKAKSVSAKEKPKAPKPAKKPRNGVGMAIFATIIIVLGLAAMATYAYLKTQ